MRLVLALIALACAASAALAFPIIDGNRFDRARVYGFCDTLMIPAGNVGTTKARTIYLIANTGNVLPDSVLLAWRNGGAVPAFRRIQGMRFGTDLTGGILNVTIYRDGATSSGNRFGVWPDWWLSLPIEADSIVVKTATGNAVTLQYCAW